MVSNGWVLHPGWGFRDEMALEAPALAASFADAHGFLVGEIPPGSVVVPRFRALPFGRELEAEVAAAGSSLVNSYAQHRFAADLGEWFAVFSDLTPATWQRVEEMPAGEAGPFVVKGETNSRRSLWSTHCFAPDRSALGPVLANLGSDGMVGYQKLYIRRFVPLHSFGVDVVGMPVSDEHRVFYFDGEELARGFYWVSHLDLAAQAGFEPDPSRVPGSLVEEVGRRLRDRIRFAACDFARTADGDWILVEVNDGSMSGCCGVDPSVLYRELAARL